MTDLTPAAFAAQARELVQRMHGLPTWPHNWYTRSEDGWRHWQYAADNIAAALGAVCDAARAERAEEANLARRGLDALRKERDRLADEVRQLRKALAASHEHQRYVDLVTSLLDIAQGNWSTPDDGQTFKTGEFAKWMQARAREVLLKHRLLIPATEPSHG